MQMGDHYDGATERHHEASALEHHREQQHDHGGPAALHPA